MDDFSVEDVVAATGAISHNADGNAKFNKVVTDDREADTNSLFVAIKGERFDGHDFAAKALKNGAKAVLAERPIKGVPYILVKDTKQALLDLAAFNRTRFQGVLVGVTGSVGKTSAKEMISLVLSQKYNCLKTCGNLNNAIGMSKTLFGLDKSHDAAVVEMGMSNLGEISALSRSAKPDIAVITNIGYSHLENLQTRDNILKAKLEILDGAAKDAPLIVGADNDMLKGLTVPNRKIIRCGVKNKDVDFKADNIRFDENRTLFEVKNRKGERVKVALNVLGTHNVYNALFGFAVADLFNIDIKDAAGALETYKPFGYRQRIVCKKGIKFILDCYNSSPESLESAVSILEGTKADGRKIAVLGDMLELGRFSKKLHELAGEQIKKSGIDMLFCIGDESEHLAKSVKGDIIYVEHFKDKEKLGYRLLKEIKEGDVVLFKASRALKLETVAEFVMDS